ncbi:23S rRNA (guanosine(2251)-2'-O)-methyltransferase RlmB [Natronosporangium hydrolyticum]|uniref:23S rRNA (Guanosine(2251)-2'-O)-methyltransferase RlmB n=1 Tax=Natronosporangium hydrolyticum TaxID=2811111 RepID=A0A895YDY7_9ACTN|nr:23S rRNA (guanosine(2251)-2'-O)-methyltransferase RlmB [Natronosporangium hydrolyticum]QSB14382.1 23S rRNA (guanosine(2251)-2'-O)-methyltransferase RlmB [Natronosporangium hydrolyticum]
MPRDPQPRSKRTQPKPPQSAGSGIKRRASLKGKGRTLPAEERPWHKAYSGPEPLPARTARSQEKDRKKAAERAAKLGRSAPGSGGGSGSGSGGRSPVKAKPRGQAGSGKDGSELLVGRNPVVEALRAHVPATALYLAVGIDVDDRVHESIRTAADRGLAVMEVGRGELDRLTGGVLHQGIGLQVPPYAYLPFEDVLAAAVEHQQAPLLVALDGVTDPRNLGAVIRSAAAFGAHGLFLPQRRAAGMTATAWRTSAGAAARLPVARVTNLTRSLKACQEAGLVVVGLDADAPTNLYDLEAAVDPLVVVVGSEGRGLSRLVGNTCDLRVNVPMSADVESLNASVAAAVTLAEVARRRRVDARGS